MNISELKLNLQLRTKKGAPIIIAGLVFWMMASISGVLLPEKVTLFVYLIGVGCIFPLGILISSMLKIDIFAKGNPLGVLGGIIGGINLLNIPVVLMVYFKEPSWMPFIVGAAVGSHFLPYVWIYDSKSYLFLSIGTVLSASFFGIKFISNTFIVTPIAIGVVYLITIICLSSENKKLSKLKNPTLI